MVTGFETLVDATIVYYTAANPSSVVNGSIIKSD